MESCVLFVSLLFAAGVVYGDFNAEPIMNSEICNNEKLAEQLSDPTYHECVSENLNFTVMVKDFNDALNYENLGDFVSKHCPKWTAFLTCMENNNKDIIPCSSEETAMVLRSNMNAVKAAVNYLCQDSGSILANFFAGGGIHCIIQQEKALQACTADEVGNPLLNIGEISETGALSTNSVPRFYDLFECNLYHNMSNCIHNVLDHCPSNLTKHFFNHLLIAMLQETPCWDALKSVEDSSWEHIALMTLLPTMVPTRARTCPGGITGYEMVKKEVVSAVNCWNENIDMMTLVEEFNSQMKKKNLETGLDVIQLLKHYCPKLKEANMCIANFLDAFQPCANTTEKVVLTSNKNAIQALVEFTCYRNGERVLLFLKEQGPDCFKGKERELGECIRKAAPANLTKLPQDLQNVNINSVSKMWLPQSYNEEECRIINTVNECVRTVMRQCKDRTPANLLTSLIQYMIKDTPCSETSSAVLPTSALWLLILSLFVTLLYRH